MLLLVHRCKYKTCKYIFVVRLILLVFWNPLKRQYSTFTDNYCQVEALNVISGFLLTWVNNLRNHRIRRTAVSREPLTGATYFPNFWNKWGLPARERNLYATGLSNCPKLSDNPRIQTVEYTPLRKEFLNKNHWERLHPSTSRWFVGNYRRAGLD